MRSPEVRATQMVRRWYPASWRSNQETEFVAFLEDSISERSFWPRRGFGVAWEGSRLRLIDLRQRAETPPTKSMSFGYLWLAVSTALFLGYSIVFLSTASTAYAHGFEALTAPLSAIGGSLVIGFGLLVLTLGALMAWRNRSWRSWWPFVALGASLIGLVSSNWWFASGRGLWGWTSLASVVAGLNPGSWTTSYASPSLITDIHMYLITNLLLILVVVVALVAITNRFEKTRAIRREGVTRYVGFVLLAAVTAGVWVWVVNLTGGRDEWSMTIALVVTVSAVSTLTAALYRMTSGSRIAG